MAADTDTPVSGWFADFCATPDAQSAFAFVLAHPALLWDRHWPAMEGWIAAHPPAARPPLLGQLTSLRNLAANYAKQPNQWPDATGPIHDLAQRVIGDEWSLAHGLAAAPKIAAALAPLYVEVVCWRLRNRANDGDWQYAVTAHRLLLAATDALTDNADAMAMRRDALLTWLEIVCIACTAVPDGRLFTDAVARATAHLAAETDPVRAAEAMKTLGVLHLDPWIAGRTTTDTTEKLRIWRQRFTDTHGPAAAADPHTRMPEPVAALTTAILWLQRAQPQQSGVARGRTLKTLSAAVVWLAAYGGPADPQAARRFATEALTLLPAGREDRSRLELQRLLLTIPSQEAGSIETPEPAPSASRALLWLDPSDVMREHGKVDGRESYLWLARSLLSSDPDGSLALMLRLWPTLVEPGDEPLRRQVALVLFAALACIEGPAQVLAAAGADRAALGQALAQAGSAGGWSIGHQVAVAAGIAHALRADDREAEALALVARALKLAPERAPALVAPLMLLRADLILSTAANAYAARQWDQAVERYIEAALAFLRIDMTEAAQDALAHAEDVAFADAARSPQVFAIGLATCAGELAAIGPPRLADNLQRTWLRVMARINAQPVLNTLLLWFILQAAKGAAFAAMLQRADYDWRRDPDAMSLLSRIADLRRTTVPVARTENDRRDNDLILVSYDVTGGQDAMRDDPLVNLERRFDAHVFRRLTDRRDEVALPLMGDDLLAAIGPRTVLMSVFAGRTEDNRQSMTTVLRTDRDIAAATVAMSTQSGMVAMDFGGRRAEMTLWALGVADVRGAVNEDPGPGDVVPDGAAKLATGYATFLADTFPNHLAAFRAGGRDHLCIHPHGPFHFHPLHLLGPQGKALADDWIVTTIPHPTLLRGRSDPPPPDPADRLPVVALGLDFTDRKPHNLRPLPGAAAEAQAVAAIFGGPCWLNADATEARFLEAITGATRVHIATHGAHDVSAPLFQRLYLHPDAAADGIFHAYEALGLDLRHLDLITLSACETALGRCDITDTLRGLPASLFIAGAQTIIATLWPVDNRAARQFFETLYGALARGVGKLDAFRQAQLAVRANFPAYRDWGTFQYAGRW